MLIATKLLWQLLWVRLQALREDDRGMTTEAVIVTVALAGLAIFAIGIVVREVRNEANSLNVDAPEP